MASFGLLIPAFFLLCVSFKEYSCDDTFKCLSCSTDGDDCPLNPSEAQLKTLIDNADTCPDADSVCAKYVVAYEGGSPFVFRGCAPADIGGNSVGDEYCTFVLGLQNVFVREKLVANATCTPCKYSFCNT